MRKCDLLRSCDVNCDVVVEIEEASLCCCCEEENAELAQTRTNKIEKQFKVGIWTMGPLKQKDAGTVVRTL